MSPEIWDILKTKGWSDKLILPYTQRKIVSSSLGPTEDSVTFMLGSQPFLWLTTQFGLWDNTTSSFLDPRTEPFLYRWTGNFSYSIDEDWRMSINIGFFASEENKLPILLPRNANLTFIAKALKTFTNPLTLFVSIVGLKVYDDKLFAR